MERYRKYKKRIIILVILFLAAVIVAGGSILYVNNHRAQVAVHEYHRYGEEQVIAHEYEEEQGTVLKYEQDYPELYQEELRIIFGEDCEIGEKNTIFVEGHDCDCGISESSYQYDTWEVTYHDWRGETFTQTIENHYSLEKLQYYWLKSHLNQYYDKKYVMDYFDDETFIGYTDTNIIKGAYCSVSIGVYPYTYSKDPESEYQRIQEGNHKYHEQLLAAYRERDTMLRLPELNCEEIYNQYPITTSFYLSIDDQELSGEEKAVHEKAVQDRILEMIQAIQDETDDTCNLEVRVTSAKGYEDLYDGEREWRYRILQGKPIEPDTIYSLAHAHAYEGIYW